MARVVVLLLAKAGRIVQATGLGPPVRQFMADDIVFVPIYVFDTVCVRVFVAVPT